MDEEDKISIQMIEDHEDMNYLNQSKVESNFDQSKLYIFPGSMEKALIHRNANSLGVDVEEKQRLANEVCECCKQVKKEKQLSYFCLTENENILKWGWGIPQYLTLQKLIIVLLILVILLYCCEFVVASYKLCNNLSQYQQIIGNIICYQSFSMQIAPEIVVKLFFQNLKYGKFTALILVLGFLLIFYVYAQYFYSKQYLKKDQKQSVTTFTDRSLLFLHFPDESQEFIENFVSAKVKENLGKDIKIKIEQICRLHNYQDYNKYFSDYVDVYEEMNVKYDGLNAQDLQKAKNIVKKIDSIKQNGIPFAYRMIVTFETTQDYLIAKNALKRSLLFNIIKYFTIRKMKTFTSTEFYTIQTASHPQDYIWVNLGGSILSKIKYQFISIGIIGCIIIGLGKVLYDLTQLENSFEGENENEIDSSTKATQYCVSFGLFAIEKAVVALIKKVSQKSLHFNKTSQFRFYLQYTITFLLIYYVTMPCFLFFLISNDSLFTQQQQKVLRTSSFLNEIIVQVALSLFFFIFDYQFMWHFYKKYTIQKKFQLTGKIDLCQKKLNEAMQKPDFNLEKRFLLLFKLLAFSGFFIFICPYSLFFILGGLVFLYLIDKFLLIQRYSIYSYRSTKYIKSSVTLMSTWMFVIVMSVFFLTEGEQVNFNIIQGSNDEYYLSSKYYISMYIVSALAVFGHISLLVIYPHFKNKRKCKQAILYKENQHNQLDQKVSEEDKLIIPQYSNRSSMDTYQKDNHSYNYHYEMFKKQFECKILDDFYASIL